MKPYRIKHISTGLYYKPGDINLSKTGKVYQTANNILTYVCRGYVPIYVRKGSKIHETTKDTIRWELDRFRSYYVGARIPITDFTKEEL